MANNTNGGIFDLKSDDIAVFPLKRIQTVSLAMLLSLIKTYKSVILTYTKRVLLNDFLKSSQIFNLFRFSTNVQCEFIPFSDNFLYLLAKFKSQYQLRICET